MHAIEEFLAQEKQYIGKSTVSIQPLCTSKELHAIPESHTTTVLSILEQYLQSLQNIVGEMETVRADISEISRLQDETQRQLSRCLVKLEKTRAHPPLSAEALKAMGKSVPPNYDIGEERFQWAEHAVGPLVDKKYVFEEEQMALKKRRTEKEEELCVLNGTLKTTQEATRASIRQLMPKKTMEMDTRPKKHRPRSFRRTTPSDFIKFAKPIGRTIAPVARNDIVIGHEAMAIRTLEKAETFFTSDREKHGSLAILQYTLGAMHGFQERKKMSRETTNAKEMHVEMHTFCREVQTAVPSIDSTDHQFWYGAATEIARQLLDGMQVQQPPCGVPRVTQDMMTKADTLFEELEISGGNIPRIIQVNQMPNIENTLIPEYWLAKMGHSQKIMQPYMHACARELLGDAYDASQQKAYNQCFLEFFYVIQRQVHAFIKRIRGALDAIDPKIAMRVIGKILHGMEHVQEAAAKSLGYQASFYWYASLLLSLHDDYSIKAGGQPGYKNLLNKS